MLKNVIKVKISIIYFKITIIRIAKKKVNKIE